MKVYAIFEKPADAPEYAPGVCTRVYLEHDEDKAREHVEDNDDPKIKRWLEEQED